MEEQIYEMKEKYRGEYIGTVHERPINHLRVARTIRTDINICIYNMVPYKLSSFFLSMW